MLPYARDMTRRPLRYPGHEEQATGRDIVFVRCYSYTLIVGQAQAKMYLRNGGF